MSEIDEKAKAVIEEACTKHKWIQCQGILAHCAHRDSIAKALRECAAEALAQASRDLQPVDESVAICDCWKVLRSEAAIRKGEGR